MQHGQPPVHPAQLAQVAPSPEVAGLPRFASALLAPGGRFSWRLGILQTDVLVEMIQRTETRQHEAALRAFNTATTDAARRSAVAEFYGVREEP